MIDKVDLRYQTLTNINVTVTIIIRLYYIIFYYQGGRINLLNIIKINMDMTEVLKHIINITCMLRCTNCLLKLQGK